MEDGEEAASHLTQTHDFNIHNMSADVDVGSRQEVWDRRRNSDRNLKVVLHATSACLWTPPGDDSRRHPDGFLAKV